MKLTVVPALLALSASVFAQDAYWENSNGEIWRNSNGECWQTINWTPAKSIPGCDGKPVTKAAPVRPAAPAPTHKPEPVVAKAKEAPAVRDSDGDGVPDDRDKCPNTRKGAKVDKDGCYIVLKEAVKMTIDVKFPPGSAHINGAGDTEIKKLVDFMNQYPQTRVEVAGHTDNTGNAAANRKLSQARADAVRQHLISEFKINGSRVTAKGYGPDKPIADNKTAAGRNANRRVEATISQTVEKIEE